MDDKIRPTNDLVKETKDLTEYLKGLLAYTTDKKQVEQIKGTIKHNDWFLQNVKEINAIRLQRLANEGQRGLIVDINTLEILNDKK